MTPTMHDMSRRFAMTPTQRVRDLAAGGPDPLTIASALYRADVRHVLIGDVAAAAHGWPITLARGEYLIVPDQAKRNLSRLEAVAHSLGAGEPLLDAPYGELDVTLRWALVWRRRAGGDAPAPW